MDNRTLTLLEYQKILKIISDFATTSPGEERLMELTPMTDPGEVLDTLGLVSEIRELIPIDGSVPMGGISDIRPILEELSVEGFYLSPGEIQSLASNLTAGRRLRSFILALKEKYPGIAALVMSIEVFKDVEGDIARAIGPRGEILDTASLHLKDIRKRIRKKRDDVNSLLTGLIGSLSQADVLQETIITIRNGRYVLPIKTDFKGRVNGIVHDRSQSGATLFVEPLKVVDGNNELSFLIREEKEEERKVLLRLSNQLRELRGPIYNNQEKMTEFDTLMARALTADAMGGIVPELDTGGCLSFISARHPLLTHNRTEGEKHTFDRPGVVPIDIHIGKKEKIIILSGANTGGKTAALKTLGLLSLMFSSAIPIPVDEGSRAVLFKDIFADIGDEQDIEGDLSTFSAKVARLKHILTEAGSGSLVLIDEIMSGTDPEQGSGLAMASLDFLSDKGATILVTTHLNTLKSYALNREDATNVSVLFDETAHAPLYRLNYGTPGGSNALMVAKSLNLPDEVIENARKNLSHEGRHLMDLIVSLEGERAKIEQYREAQEGIKDRLSRLEGELSLLVEKIREKKDDIVESFRARISESIREHERRFKALFSRMEASSSSSGETSSLSRGETHQQFHETKRSMRQQLPEADYLASSPEEFLPGDTVSIRGVSVKGEIVNITNGRADIDMGGRRVSVDVRELIRGVKSTATKGAAHFDLLTDPKTEVNVIGLTIDDAIPIVDKAIDTAVLGGLTALDIIHGYGTGRLRNAIRFHLKGHSLVRDVKVEVTNEGVTTAELT